MIIDNVNSGAHEICDQASIKMDNKLILHVTAQIGFNIEFQFRIKCYAGYNHLGTVDFRNNVILCEFIVSSQAPLSLQLG